MDAAIGTAVALAFSQLLFAPEPLRLLRRAEATVLSRLEGGLRTTAGVDPEQTSGAAHPSALRNEGAEDE